MNSPRAKFTMPVIPNVSVMPRAMMPYIAPMIAPLRTWPRTSCVTPWLGQRPYTTLFRSHLEGAALLEPDDVEVEDGLALLVEADLPEPVVGHRHERLLDGGGVVDGASLLHRLDQHVDVVVARGRAEGRLIVREVALVEVLVGLDELRDLWILLLGLLEVLGDVDHVLVEAVLVLEAGTEGAAHQEELLQLAGLRRLPDDVIEVGIGVAREEEVGLPGRDLGQNRGEVLGAGLEVVEAILDPLLLEHGYVDVFEHLAALVVLEQHGDLLGARGLDQVVHHQLAEPVGARVPVPRAHQELVAGRADIVVDPRGAAPHQDLAVELARVGSDGEEDVGEKGPEDVLGLVHLDETLELDRRLLGLSAGVQGDELDLVGLAPDLEAARLVDLVHRERGALRGHPAVDGVGARLGLDLADLHDVLGARRSHREPEDGQRENRAVYSDASSRSGHDDLL